jgi:6-phosphogluconolactonase (cycloisomerase 2 family)
MNLNLNRRTTFRTAAAAAAIAALAGLSAPAFAQTDDEGGSLRHGKVFISSNAPSGNQVLVYTRVTGGAPTFLGSYATAGNGTGAGLGSQGAVTLSRDGRYLFVVNAGSNTVSTFTFGGGTMTLTSVVNTNGATPTSVAEYGGLVYVMNAAGDGNVAGFRNNGGVLTPLADGVRGLSQVGGTVPSQVSINHYGDVLVVTERGTNRLTSYSITASGTLSRQAVTASPGAAPFGHAFTPNDTLVVSEAAASSVSSFRFVDNSRFDAPRVVTPALGNGQGAACWIATTPNGRFAFSANAATSNVSSFGVMRDGRLTLLQSAAASTGANAGALDMAVSPDGQQLHVFASRTPQIVSFTISASGGLTALGASAGMPLGSAGMAAN